MSNPMKNMYKCKPRQLKNLILDCLRADLVPFVQSSPGMGKSTIIRQVARERGLKLIDHRLSTSEPTDLSGLPHFGSDGRARYVPFGDLFPLDGDPLPKDPQGKDMQGWLIFFDEANSASRQVQAATYKIVLDKMVGQHYLHDSARIVMAGNLSTDRAIVTPMSTAMQSRLVHIELEVDFEQWVEDVALPQQYDPRIVAFLSAFPEKLLDFRPDHHDRTFCCPRTWEFVNRLLTDVKVDSNGNVIRKALEVDENKNILIAGTITAGVAAEFKEFLEVYGRIPSISAICDNPEGVPLIDQSDKSLSFATITSMAQNATKQNFEKLATYADRFYQPMRILFYRYALMYHPGLRTHPGFAKKASLIIRDLME